MSAVAFCRHWEEMTNLNLFFFYFKYRFSFFSTERFYCIQNNKSVLKSIHAFFEILSLKREFALFIRYSGGHVCLRWGFNIRVPNVSFPYMYFDLWLYLWNNSVYKFPISFYDNSAFLGVSAYCNCFHDIIRHRSNSCPCSW